MKKVYLLLATLGGAFALSATAEAAVFSSGTVKFDYYSYGGPYGGGGSPATFAAPGSTGFFNYFNVSVSGNKITYNFLNEVTWSDSAISLNTGGLYVDNGAVISSVSGIPAFTSVTLDPSSLLGSSGFTASNLTWNASAAAVTWKNLTFHAGDTVVLEVNGTDTGAVPEPETWAMMVLGFGVVGGAMRRRQKVSVSFA